MTLIKCPECGTEVEEGTVSCPKCGCSLEGIKLERKPAESPKQEPDLNELDALRKIQKSMEHIESIVFFMVSISFISSSCIGGSVPAAGH